MKRSRSSLGVLFFLMLLASQAGAQTDKITIPAGTPEDHDLQSISNEQDASKKLSLYQDFVQKYSANSAAVAYGNWQISQAYQTTGDLDKALDYGDKALVGAPRNLDILVSQASIAQQAKTNQKLMAYIEKYSAAFPDSKFQDQVSSYAMYTLGPGQLNDQPRLIAYGEKTLTANPNSLPALLLMAGTYVDDAKPGSLAKAVTYSQKAIAVAKDDDPDADKPRKLSAGMAHSILGYAYIKQDKTPASISEFRAGAALLKGQDDQQYSIVLYRLGFAYAKLKRVHEARDVLAEAVKIPGPVQNMSQDLLAKVNAARAKAK